MGTPRFAQSLRFKVSAAFGVLVAVTVTALGFLLYRTSAAGLVSAHREGGRALARGLARNAEDAVVAGDRAGLGELLARLGDEPRVRYLEVFDARGALLARWRKPGCPSPRLLPPDHDAAPIRDALLGDEPITEFDVTIQPDASAVAHTDAQRNAPAVARPDTPADTPPDANADARPDADADARPDADADTPPDAIADTRPDANADRRTHAPADTRGVAPTGAPRGTVRVALSRAGLEERLAAAFATTLRLVLAAAFLGMLATLVLVRSFLSPVGRLIGAMDSIGAGSYQDVSELPHGKDELGALSAAFARMTHKLRGAQRALVAANTELEERVRTRTAELQAALEELKSLDRLKDNFLSSVSHEFRTPLTAIRCFTEILAAFPDEPIGTRHEFLTTILGHVERLSRMVDDVMDLVRLESDELPLCFAPVDVIELAQEVAAEFRPELEEQGLRVSIRRHGDVPEVRGDALRLRQVLRNLVSNAVKFSNAGESIEISARALGHTVELTVLDHGVGIAPAEQGRIFERFRQLGDTLTEKPKGAGLGLPLCKGIVERHGGSIEVRSLPGRGSAFTVRLPAARAPGAPREGALFFDPKRAGVPATPR